MLHMEAPWEICVTPCDTVVWGGTSLGILVKRQGAAAFRIQASAYEYEKFHLKSLFIDMLLIKEHLVFTQGLMTHRADSHLKLEAIRGLACSSGFLVCLYMLCFCSC